MRANYTPCPCCPSYDSPPRMDGPAHPPLSPTGSPTSPPPVARPLGQPQPPSHTNPIRNTRMGAPMPPQSASPTTLTRPLNPSVAHIRSLPMLSRPSPRPCSPLLLSPQPPDSIQDHIAQNQRKKKRRPRNITKKGLKQSMELHTDKVARHAYNKFRVNIFTILAPLLTLRCSRTAFVPR